MTAGHPPCHAGRVIITASPVRPRTVPALPWAWATGLLGLVANLLLMLFFLLAEPFNEVHNSFSWLGPTNDWVVAAQFLAFLPVALALRSRLPTTRAGDIATGAAAVGMVAAVALQLLLVTGQLDFGVQVVAVIGCFLLIFGWVFTVSSIGHRSGALPRPVTRFGLLLGASYPLGLLIAAPGLLFAWGSAPQLAFVIPGVLLGSIGWLGLPVWPLLLARRVFSRPLANPSRKGSS